MLARKFDVVSLALASLVSFLIAGCAHAPAKIHESNPEVLMAKACGAGRDIQRAQGSVSLKAHSAEASGQFPAAVDASVPSNLKLEVTTLLGGTEAVIRVAGDHYSVKSSHKNRNREGNGSWGGIPLHWSSDLFLGRFPCPTGVKATTSVDAEGDLVIATESSLGADAEKFVYHYRDWNGGPWPESLHWERAGAFASSVDFKFDDPEEGTGSPLKWEAKSSQGEVKVKWRDRNVSR